MTCGQLSAMNARKRRKRKTIGVSDAHYEFIKQLAEKENTTMFEIVERAISKIEKEVKNG